MIEKIVSGGQTGVDQAGLMVASELGIEIGGWCPAGGLDENGICVLDKYSELKQTTTFDPAERTILNIRDSDGTLIIVPDLPLPEQIKDGTWLTIKDAKRQNKPLLIISVADKSDINQKILEWININNIKTLNIAGPRESNSPGINHAASALFREVFIMLCPRLAF
ncbi:putative molybdenum carrier protein [Legionella dresdenensis]|uniref:Molybdenum carrier protein n=1 Tax=Legionella dresdenensis TaxID=450200 RepID=A0ABV8CEB4_9GAMM